jgi:hypothetical protein
MKKHIKGLKSLFPNSMIRDIKEFGSGETGGLWTSFGEDGTSDSDHMGHYNEHDKKLKDYMEKHRLYAEWYDAGTLMIYPDSHDYEIE